MAGTNTAAIPFTVWKVIGSSDALPLVRRLPQAATQTFNYGTPVSLVSGYLQATATITGTSIVIAGISQQAGDSIGTAGVAPVGGASLTYGSVPNQTSAVNIPMGAPMVDGNTGTLLASNTTWFVGCVDAAHTTAAADIGTIYGLTKDTTTNNWFVDTTITSAASGACVEVMEFVDPVGTGLNGSTTTTTGGRVAFRVTAAYQQLFT
jgi:hypothetical protein